MTAIQICALTALILCVGLTYWGGYRGGRSDGHFEGIDEGKAIQQADNSEAIRELQLLLEQAKSNHKSLYQHYKRALAASKFGQDERQALLAIADQLKLAAETFRVLSAPGSTKTALELRDKAQTMAALLEPIVQETAA
ncbi:hypothetical protein HX866_12910 [Pseudomonas gingeri]|uniref:hypothetical protein n=1 Tax=Pseudomonas gingeri TaxID=117681 RepID=UPI0015A0F1D8|nr:hypothetical protein [Pseudomonas gingeri]NWA25791.1 hypothetical protein [Pseudomonas gingeri]